MRKPLETRFWEKVSKRDVESCWDWTAGLNPSGYGWMLADQGKPKSAHRICAVLHGLIDSLSSPLHVLHKCDNRKCCNPAHLFTGTNADNVADRVRKGRSGGVSHFGDSNGMSKLTNLHVRQIRGLYFSAMFSQSQLAKRFGVRQPQISRIVNLVRCGGIL